MAKKKPTSKRKTIKVDEEGKQLETASVEDFGEDLPMDTSEESFKRRKKFPSPKPWNKTFSKYWNDYIVDISKRENFKRGHLSQLEILCDLHQEYEEISKLVSKIGYSYKSIGRNGTQFKVRPEVQQLNRLRADIRNYSKTLGLLLSRDKTMTAVEGGGEDESWD